MPPLRFLPDPDVLAADRNDTVALIGYANENAATIRYEVISGRPEIFWIETKYRIGDAFSGCQGLGLAFPKPPSIRQIQYSNDPSAGQRTVLHLSDLRHSPEVGTEA